MKAVAAEVPALAPFFKEDGSLGNDVSIHSARPRGGVQASNRPGLYGGVPGQGSSGSSGTGSGSGRSDNGSTGLFGGSTKPGACAVAKLKKFLTDPKNHEKAREWARILQITPDEIPAYIDRLTPVVLRHDTLVKNHDYKNGKAVPFDALLQAGIAVLVDQQGLPAVKCSCGNPLRPFTGDRRKISVKFNNGNKKWADYRQSDAVVVQPPPGKPAISRLELVDVHDSGVGITRRLGAGGKDATFHTGTPREVPQVKHATYAEASRRLTAAGLSATYAGDTPPADDAVVTASDPAAGSAREWGTYVTLYVQSDSGGEPSTPPSSGGTSTGPGPDTPSTSGGTDAGKPTSSSPSGTSPSDDRSSTSPSGDSTGPSSSATTGGTGSGSGTPSGSPPVTPSSSAPPTPSESGTGGPGDGSSTHASPTHASPTLSSAPVSSPTLSSGPSTSESEPGGASSGVSAPAGSDPGAPTASLT